MNVHSFLSLDPNNELVIDIKGKDKGKNYQFKVGKISKNQIDFFKKFGGAAKTINLANQTFRLSDKEILSFIHRTVSVLPCTSDEIRAVILFAFEGLSKKKHISEAEFLTIIDAGLQLDEFCALAQKLHDSTIPFTSDELHFIFSLPEKMKITIQKFDPELQKELSSVYEILIDPLVKKAKQEIKSNPRHLATQAAAEKGRALQAGLKTIIALEKREIPPTDSEKVSQYPQTGAVFKGGKPQSKEEEHKIDALMSLSMEKGSAPLFTFSALSSRRFSSDLSDQDKSNPGMDAKPFIEGMLTFDELLKDDALYQKVIARLDQNSELMALLTAEFQFLDLHKDNLAAIPVLAQEHEKFRDLDFAYGLKGPVSFHQLLKDYLSGNIDENTKVYFSSKDKQLKSNGFQPMKTYPALLQALRSPWQFVLFDMDRALAESNVIQTQKRNGVVETVIPLRSVLIGTSWKSKPLSPVTLRTLQDPARDQRVRDWVNRRDAPIRKWMADPQTIDNLIKREIEQDKYTLSSHRRQGRDTTIKDLRTAFGEDISRLDLHRNLWTIIQKQLEDKGWFKPYKVREGDTLEGIARDHHLTVGALKALNPQEKEWVVKPNMKLRVREDVTAEGQSAQRKQIAEQLFPRLSWRQRDALFERQNRRADYLQNVQILNSLHANSPEAISILKNLIIGRSTPLNSSRKQWLLAQIQSIEQASGNQDPSAEIDMMISLMRIEFTPTYFNLVKVMYPLLADTYELLSQQAHGNEQTAGLSIGLFSRPIESMVAEMRSDSGFVQRFQSIDRSSASFFGEWVDEDDENNVPNEKKLPDIDNSETALDQ